MQLLDTEYKQAQKSDAIKRDWDNHPLPLLPAEKLAKATLEMKSKYSEMQASSELLSHLTQPMKSQRANQQALNSNYHPDQTAVLPQQRVIQRPNTTNGNIAAKRQNNWGNPHSNGAANGNSRLAADTNGRFRITAEADAENRLFAQAKVEGTCTVIEKTYYRLTELPLAHEVRPEPILKKALTHILAKFQRGECDVHWVTDQFRSIRLVAPPHPGHEDPAHPQRLHGAGLRTEQSLLSRTWIH